MPESSGPVNNEILKTDEPEDRKSPEPEKYTEDRKMHRISKKNSGNFRRKQPDDVTRKGKKTEKRKKTDDNRNKQP